MRIHILGICGTFMAGIACLAREAGHIVSGSDQATYPPMSTQLTALGISVMEGYDPANIGDDIDSVIVGNVISRGNPLMESVMERGLPYISGPQWLFEQVLSNRHVLAVAGTHGKTTTTTMLIHLLNSADLSPGYLVGGVPIQQEISACLGQSPYFIIEADEYDSAFFDKRSKFIHYHPNTLILNNLEFDHADIFADLAAIQQQFHYLVRTVPANGQIINLQTDNNIEQVLEKGCWSKQVSFGGADGQFRALLKQKDGSEFEVLYNNKLIGEVNWDFMGLHNVNNALAAIAAAHHVGVNIDDSVNYLADFKGVKRRMEVRAKINEITVYEDFAHHPTAIATTLAGLRAKIGKHNRIIAIFDPSSNTMRSGAHNDILGESLADADFIICHDFKCEWDVETFFNDLSKPFFISAVVDELVQKTIKIVRPNDHIVVMSNCGFGGFIEKLLKNLDVAVYALA